MYIRIASKNPILDHSVPGWAPNSVIIEQLCHGLNDPQQMIEFLEAAGWVVEFTATQLAEAMQHNTLNLLPQLYVDAVCCFEADSIEEWARLYAEDLVRMGYITSAGNLAEPDLRVWQVEGDIIDVEDCEGIYVKAVNARDITDKALEALKI